MEDHLSTLFKKHPGNYSVTLHGHIHESPALSGKWLVKLGETHSIQPGQEQRFTGALITLDDGEVSAERLIG